MCKMAAVIQLRHVMAALLCACALTSCSSEQAHHRDKRTLSVIGRSIASFFGMGSGDPLSDASQNDTDNTASPTFDTLRYPPLPGRVQRPVQGWSGPPVTAQLTATPFSTRFPPRKPSRLTAEGNAGENQKRKVVLIGIPVTLHDLEEVGAKETRGKVVLEDDLKKMTQSENFYKNLNEIIRNTTAERIRKMKEAEKEQSASTEEIPMGGLEDSYEQYRKRVSEKMLMDRIRSLMSRPVDSYGKEVPKYDLDTGLRSQEQNRSQDTKMILQNQELDSYGQTKSKNLESSEALGNEGKNEALEAMYEQYRLRMNERRNRVTVDLFGRERPVKPSSRLKEEGDVTTSRPEMHDVAIKWVYPKQEPISSTRWPPEQREAERPYPKVIPPQDIAKEFHVPLVPYYDSGLAHTHAGFPDPLPAGNRWRHDFEDEHKKFMEDLALHNHGGYGQASEQPTRFGEHRKFMEDLALHSHGGYGQTSEQPTRFGEQKSDDYMYDDEDEKEEAPTNPWYKMFFNRNSDEPKLETIKKIKAEGDVGEETSKEEEKEPRESDEEEEKEPKEAPRESDYSYNSPIQLSSQQNALKIGERLETDRLGHNRPIYDSSYDSSQMFQTRRQLQPNSTQRDRTNQTQLSQQSQTRRQLQPNSKQRDTATQLSKQRQDTASVATQLSAKRVRIQVGWPHLKPTS